MSPSLQEKFQQSRDASEAYCENLAIEDYGLQAMPETSPAKWHLAHTSWFFETFLLKAYDQGYQPRHAEYEVLFNSYYNSIGEQHPRAERALLSRPTVAEVMAYRHEITAHMLRLLEREEPEIQALAELGINHEQQHQELFFTDLKYNFSRNPLLPAYAEPGTLPGTRPTMASGNSGWQHYAGGEVVIGHDGDGFCFDNETPRHAVLLQDFALSDRLVTNAEYLAFIESDGYQRPELWLADGWATLTQHDWQAPLYWQQRDNQWWEFTLYGALPLEPNRPACHLSAYEADAYCRWAGHRLPSEHEWEFAASQTALSGQLLEDGIFHPVANNTGEFHGSLWQWTSSAYSAYPGYQPAAGAVGEYNGKFMSNQLVLRGGSCVTSRDHIRSSYRNFFYPPDRWQFTGIRMAKWL